MSENMLGLHIDEDVILGYDLGIGSVGWALLREFPDGSLRVLEKKLPHGEVAFALGVRAFDVPENPKTKELLNVARREHARQRITLRRRAQRLRQARKLLQANGFVDALNMDALYHPKRDNAQQIDPWECRVLGLQRLLSDTECVVALMHLATHRGFKSTSKRDVAGGSASETGKMLQAVGQIQQELNTSDSPTVGGLMLAQKRENPAMRLRNRAGMDGKAVYERTPLRSLQEQECHALFAAQRNFGQRKLTETCEQAFCEYAFSQAALQSTAHLVGTCTFEPKEKRAPTCSPTAEYFRLVQRVCQLRLLDTRTHSRRSLTLEERTKILSLLGEKAGITYAHIKKHLVLPEDMHFEGVKYTQGGDILSSKVAEKADIASKGKGACYGTYVLKKVLGAQHFSALSEKICQQGVFLGYPVTDAVAKIVSDNDDQEQIKNLFAALPCENEQRESLCKALVEGKFSEFRGVMRLSIKAMQAMIPHILRTGDYAAGCMDAGYIHSQAAQVDIGSLRQPVVAKILSEARKQFYAICREFSCIPGRVHLEMARDVGKSVEERRKIEEGISKRSEQKKAQREALAEYWQVEVTSISSTELRRYELWRSQEGRCAYFKLWQKEGARHYTGQHVEGSINIMDLQDGTNMVQIDHILPMSRTFDSSFHNQCLCITAANQAKGNQTPFEWIGSKDTLAWHEHCVWVETLAYSGLKKRNMCLTDLSAEKAGTFSERNLTDTRYGCRLMLKWFLEFYAQHGALTETYDEQGHVLTLAQGKQKRRCFARPGSITNALRILWGWENLKRNARGQRLGDCHHALDALISAACTESMLQQLTQRAISKATWQKHEPLVLPWPTAREDVPTLLEKVFVSRAERGSMKGAAHKDTLYSVRMEKDGNGEQIEKFYLRTPISKLEEKDVVKNTLPKLKDRERNAKLEQVLVQWIQGGKKQAHPPLLEINNYSTGEARKVPVHHVRLRADTHVSGLRVPRGTGKPAHAANGDMVRTDIFTKNGKFYMVPVYAWQVARKDLPKKAVKGKTEQEWLELDDSYAFCFSLQSNSYVVTQKSNGERKEGYFVCSDRSTGSITLAAANDHSTQYRGIGIQQLAIFEKYRIDRLGRKYRVRCEPRFAGDSAPKEAL